MNHMKLSGYFLKIGFGLLSIVMAMSGAYAENRSSVDTVVINEVVSSSDESAQKGELAGFDWIELHNTSSRSIKLEGFVLSDGDIENRWLLPDIKIRARGYLLIAAVGKKQAAKLRDSRGLLYADFKISSKGETVSLFDSDGELVDSVEVPPMPTNMSYGRSGTGVFAWFDTPTPEQQNAEQAYNNLSEPVRFSLPAGYYRKGERAWLEMTHSRVGSSIYYTLDGRVPTQQATKYTGPITISENAIVRARAFDASAISGSVTSASFLFDRVQLPVVSIIAEPEDLWAQDEGILARNYIKAIQRDTTQPNREPNIEVFGHVEFFDRSSRLVMATDIGVRLFGFSNRAYPQKSFRLVAKSRYGVKNIENHFFETSRQPSFKSLRLRNSGNDWGNTMLRDGFAHTLVQEYVGTQAYMPTVVYVNGQYRGIHNLRETYDKTYFKNLHGADKKDIELVEEGEAKYGDMEELQNILRYISIHRLDNDANYQQIANKVDLLAFIDYVIIETYLGNPDWPSSNEIVWRNKRHGLWSWLLIDMDLAFALYEPGLFQANIAHFTSTVEDPTLLKYVANEKGSGSAFLFSRLMENRQFSELFFERSEYHLQGTFEPEAAIALLDELAANIEPEMPRHLHLWGYDQLKVDKGEDGRQLDYFAGHMEENFLTSYGRNTDDQLKNRLVNNDINAWQQDVESIRQFLQKRPVIYQQQLNQLQARMQH